jgi:conjugal transfer pilus assembly protein TraW
MGNILISKKFCGAAIILLMVSNPTFGEDKIVDLGVHGALFEIVEEDMLEFLLKRLHSLKDSGKLQEIEDSIKEKAKERVLHPPPVVGLSETKVERSYLHDPTLVVDQDIQTPEGMLIAKRGQKVNPLNHLSLSKGLLFIDGDNKHQLHWALQHQDKFYIILTKGSPLKLGEQFGVKLYFDQAGIITKRYGIKHIPARIEQTGETLRVTEFLISESMVTPSEKELS